MGGLVIGIVIVAVVIVAALGALFFSGRDDGTDKFGKAAGSKNLDAGQASKLRKAQQSLFESKTLASRVRDVELRDLTRGAIEKAEKIIDAMHKQPDEIRCSSQFFNYYLPTMTVVLSKYLELQESGKASDDTLAKSKQYMADMASAFERQYDTMFKDEELDLTVEVEAMQMALKRDGLM